MRATHTLSKHLHLRVEWLLTGLLTLCAALSAVAFFLHQASASADNQPLNIDLAAIPDNSVVYPSLGDELVQEGQAHFAYNSNPPTSGPHTSGAIPGGVYTSTLTDEALVHNLEDGCIWLSYRDASDADAIKLLTELQQRNKNTVIVTYRPQNTSRISAAAWTRLLSFDTLSDSTAAELQAFILRYQNRGPEAKVDSDD